ncbi:DUF4340 domain-containing protein [Thiocapsa roseopersicina]|uniref:DUF4340 domain-containing protein n=1 Tax=Thiocapsa roseopersicina TaxID=1058 RepID=A0A1H2Z284_THIRO|nr:DUF4340 domain-containing protein [Thiocapsa roseopersicina]SDX11476.1 protein of unknown function [Thiocapsa roseopersicina]
MTVQSDTGWRPDLRAPIVMGLAGLLVLQILLALGLNLGGGRTLVPSGADTPLLGIAPDQVQGLRIDSGDGTESVTLARRGDTWIVADLADLPVQGSKVEQFLGELAALKRPLPIATSEEAQERFKVADDTFERRLTLEGETGPIAGLLIGDSPGFKRVFAGIPGEPGVYELRLALSDVSARRDDWIDVGLLRLEGEQINRIATSDWILNKDQTGVWTLADSDRPVDEETVSALMLRIANLGYRGVLGIADDPAYNQQDPLIELQIGLTDGSKRRYRISRAKDSEDYVLKDPERPWYFKLSEFDLGELLDIESADLLAANDAADPSAGVEPSSPSEILPMPEEISEEPPAVE